MLSDKQYTAFRKRAVEKILDVSRQVIVQDMALSAGTGP